MLCVTAAATLVSNTFLSDSLVQVYDSLSSGNWSFQVRARDAAGNVGLSSQASDWTLALGIYAQLGPSIPTLIQS